ncbi:hypothetical protein C5Y93_13480 [Blastopirellula marina]|uniref:Uncharacterized protein n=1 Tax=Blastopirellula marina TaxID=124 RepID=A0A2S8GLZ5_9BACT|nr:hypothetical protein C5Y93_13480 [Blastopirellula marina]
MRVTLARGVLGFILKIGFWRVRWLARIMLRMGLIGAIWVLGFILKIEFGAFEIVANLNSHNSLGATWVGCQAQPDLLGACASGREVCTQN